MMTPSPAPMSIPGTPFPMLELLPVGPEQATMVHEWISDTKTRPWLDLGSGRQNLDKRELFLMLTGQRTWARLFRIPGTTAPLGLVCLNDVRNEMGSAEVWGVRGIYSSSAPPNVAVAAFLLALANGFLDFERQVIGSWVVEGNELSIGMHHLLGMVETGRQRSRHVIGTRRLDRRLFDITRAEFAKRFPDVPGESGYTMREVSADA